jgi:hypothetical protein
MDLKLHYPKSIPELKLYSTELRGAKKNGTEKDFAMKGVKKNAAEEA